MLSDCEDFEHETQFQLITLFAISTSVSLLNLIALFFAYDRDPEIDEIPNFAERQRAFFLHERLPNLSNIKNKSFFHRKIANS